jgi:hypothetical protein
MNYKATYMKIIKKAKSENRQKTDDIYYEAHHILPKSLFPLWKNRKSNLVLLTAREHLFCHMLLVKIYPKSHEMWSALWYMSSKSKRKDSKYPRLTLKDYERIKIYYAESNSNHLKGKKNPNMRRNFSDETRKKLSDKHRGNTNIKGKSWWTKDGKSTFAFECPGDGWIKGRNTKGATPWNKGQKMSEEQRRQHSQRLKDFMSKLSEDERKEKYGNRKGIPAWNKGKSPSLETKQNMSIAQKERFKNNDERRKIGERFSKKVIELNSNKVFNSLKECAEFYGHTNPWVIYRMKNPDDTYHFKYIEENT